MGGAADLWQVLEVWRKEVAGDEVFPWPKATHRQFYEDWERLSDAAGLTERTPEDQHRGG